MIVTVRNIRAPRQGKKWLAEAEVELDFGQGLRLGIDDLRIMRNQAGAYWVAWPNFAVPLADAKGGKHYVYQATIIPSQAIKQPVSDKVLEAFRAKGYV